MKCLKFSKNKLKKTVEDEKTFQAHGFDTTNFVKKISYITKRDLQI